MVHQEPEASDPMLLVGVGLPAASPQSMRAMAETFVEELARLRYSRERILSIFRSPSWPACHAALRSLGEPVVRRLIDQYCDLFSPSLEV